MGATGTLFIVSDEPKNPAGGEESAANPVVSSDSAPPSAPVEAPSEAPASAPGPQSGFGRSAIVVTLGAMIANVAAYLVHLPASRWLGPELYGEFAALLSVQLIASVPTLALQAVVARDRTQGAGTRRLRRVGYSAAVALAVIVAVAAWPVAWALSTSVWTVAAAGLGAPLLAVLGVEMGLLQAEGRFRRFSFFSALTGVGKAAPAVAALALTGQPAPALAAEALGVALVYVAARASSRGEGAAGSAAPAEQPAETPAEPPARTDLAAVARASQVQLALIALTSADLLIARSVLSPGDAGLYALGSIATKVGFWLPAAIATVLFPQMARPESHARARRLALSSVAAIGVALCVAAALVAPLVPVVIGEDYAPVSGLLWLFTALGAVQSILQVLLLAGIAAHRTRESGFAWLGVLFVAAPPLLARSGALGGGARDALSVPVLASWALASLLLTAGIAAFALRSRPTATTD